MKISISLLMSVLLIMLLCVSSMSYAALEEVVVTAQKRVESVQDIPISITALSGDELADRGLTDMQDVARYVPNFDMPNSNNIRNVRVRIRGIGSSGTNPGIESSVGTFLDGLYMPSGAMSFGELADIQSVEILRGPQGTLYGRNTPIGALNVTTRKPGQEAESMLRAGYGEYNQAVLNGYIGGGLSDDVAGRMSFWYRDREGYEENLFTGDDVNDNNEWGLRGKLLWSLSDAVDVTAIAYYSEIERECCMAEQLSANDPNFGIATPGFLATQSAAGFPFVNFDENDHKVDGDDEGDDSSESLGLSVQVDWDLDNDFVFTSITGYQDWENSVNIAADSLKNPVLTSVQTQINEVMSQEFRITSPTDDMIEYLAGLFFYAQDTSFNSDATIFGGANRVFPVPAAVCPAPCTAQAGDFVVTEFEQETRSIAAYGNLTFRASEVWDITAGLRWSQDKKDAKVNHSNAAGNGFVIDRLIFPENLVGNVDRSESKVTWSLNTRYNLSDDVMLFATTSTGFKSGGFNSRRLPAGSTLEFEEEESFTVEAGMKTFLADRTVMLNFTLFHTTVEDFQESTLAPTGTGFIVGNAGEQEVKGLEADFTYAPNDSLLINGSVAYLDSEYTDFNNAQCAAGQTPTNANGTCDRTGERPNFSPEYQYTLGAQWTQPIDSRELEWFVRGDYSWRDDQVLTRVFNSDIGVEEAYGLLDLRLGLGANDEQWKVELFAKNVTDKAYKTVAASQPVGGLISGGGPSGARGFVGWYGPPKVWGVQFTLRPGL